MAIPSFKGNWRFIEGCCCHNSYFICPPQQCMFSQLATCLCIGSDCACPHNKRVPNHICTLLPFCTVAPTVGCCKTPASLQMKTDPNDFGRKNSAIIVSAVCIPALCSSNTYCLAPYTICADEASQCLCIGGDCSFPCSKTVPMTCALLGIMCYPTFGCCQSVAGTFPSDMSQ
uniref:Uncharacterized protein n=1 Tax=Pinguiococcus pyrenoidosus TaxID=172671 RepID=A0A7R9YCI2_9STRA|mmetsp:Transcript_18275/g.69274  ORF Transcript_18275/g.69274 Transcript_18275/m.69274 type:complete len:173 (+) Transcript_18275:65-583(+)